MKLASKFGRIVVLAMPMLLDLRLLTQLYGRKRVKMDGERGEHGKGRHPSCDFVATKLRRERYIGKSKGIFRLAKGETEHAHAAGKRGSVNEGR